MQETLLKLCRLGLNLGFTFALLTLPVNSLSLSLSTSTGAIMWLLGMNETSEIFLTWCLVPTKCSVKVSFLSSFGGSWFVQQRREDLVVHVLA